MKQTVFIILGIVLIASCGGRFSVVPKHHKLHKPVKEQTEIDGSFMIVSNGMPVLLRVDKNFIKRTILIASSDSIKEVAKCSYETRIDKGCRIGFKPWISLHGSYLSKDSIQSIFQYSQVKVLDDGSTCSIISEE